MHMAGSERSLKLLTPLLEWKCQKRFKLELGKPWESELSSDSDMDNFTEQCFDDEKASESDDLFVFASQKFEEEYCKDKSPFSDTDEILLLASQQFEERYAGEEVSEVVDCSVLHYGSPKTSKQVDDVRKLGVPLKTREQNKWVSNIWCDWAQHCLQSMC